MSPEDFLNARTKLGLTQKRMAEALGMGAHGWQAISGWENGHQPVPATVIVTMRLLLERHARRKGVAA